MLKSARSISHVKQIGKDDCAIACLSMVTGIPILEIVSDILNDGYSCPLSIIPIIRFLTRHKIYADKVNGSMNIALYPNSIYLATTASKLVAGAFHIVVIVAYEDSSRVFDPADNLEGEALYSFSGNVEGSTPCFEYFHLTDCSID